MDALDTSPAAALRRARQAAGLSLREAARRAGTSHATFSAYERGLKSPTLATFERLAAACNLDLAVTFTPRIRVNNGLDRGEELAAVLRLAAAFPARPAQSIEGPVIARLAQSVDA